MSTVRRFDYLEPIHMDPEREDGALATVDEATGFLQVDSRPARTGVFIYGDADGNRWGELRTEDEVFSQESLDSFKGAVLTDDHPDEFVTTENVKDVQVGHVGSDVRRDGKFMRATITVTDSATIAKIRNGKAELSNGYTATVVPHEGITDAGEEHSFRQTNIRGNHVAVVDRGRAGPMCRLLTDSGDAYSEPRHEDTMQTRKHTIGGVEHDVPVAVADALDAQAKKAEDAKLLQDAQDKLDAEAKAKEDAKKNPFAKGPDDDDDEDEKGDSAPDVPALRAKLDLLEADSKAYRDGEPQRIDTRARLLSTAASISKEIKTDGASNEDIMRAVVLEVRPEFAAKLDAEKDSPGYLKACYDQALELHSARRDASDDLTSTLHNAVKSGSRNDMQALDDMWMDKFGTSSYRQAPAQETK